MARHDDLFEQAYSTQLMNDLTILFRQAHPSFVENDEVTSQAFIPFPKDEGKPSVDDGDLTTAEAAFNYWTNDLGNESAGTWGVTCNEVTDSGLSYESNPLPKNPAHALIDFTAHPEKHHRKLAKKLKAFANARKRLHPA
jgi:hypothetical protein